MKVSYHHDSAAAKALLAKDPSLAPLFAKTEVVSFKTVDDYFYALVEAIVSQQLSGAVAAGIFNKLKAFLLQAITPATVAEATTEDLRALGLSYRKIEYLKSLAGMIMSGKIDLAKLEAMADEEIIATLTRVKGIGRWTVEMFLLFSLGRQDVFSAGDLGIRNALKKLYGKDFQAKEAEALSQRWRPNRSLVTHFLWHYLKT